MKKTGQKRCESIIFHKFGVKIQKLDFNAPLIVIEWGVVQILYDLTNIRVFRVPIQTSCIAHVF